MIDDRHKSHQYMEIKRRSRVEAEKKELIEFISTFSNQNEISSLCSVCAVCTLLWHTPLFEIFVSTHFILGKQTINIKPQQRKYSDCAAYVLNFF